MDKKMLFIYNPHAGKAAIRSNLLDIIDIFAKAEYEVTCLLFILFGMFPTMFPGLDFSPTAWGTSPPNVGFHSPR